MEPDIANSLPPLDQYESTTVLPRVVSGFYSIAKTGHTITNAKIVALLQKEGIKTTDTRIRKVINHIRTHDLVIGLCASSDGYWVERDPAKFMEYIKSVDGRIESIQNMRNKLYQQYKKMTKNETELDFKNADHPDSQGDMDSLRSQGAGSPVLGTPKSGQNQTVLYNDQKPRAVLAAEAWWESENKIQYGG